jgi:Short C-terminal domain
MIRRPIGREMARTAVVVGTATAVSGRVSRRQEERYEGQQEQYAAAAEAQAPPEAVPAEPVAQGPTEDDIERLTKLAALKDQGVLSEQEFAAEKAKILGS